MLVHPAGVDLFLERHLPLKTGDDLAGVEGERADAVVLAEGVEVHGEQGVGGLGLTVGQPPVVAGAEVRVVPADVGHGVSGGAVRHDTRAARCGQQRIELAGEREVPEVVGGELEFPSGPDPPLRGGHDSGGGHQEVDPVDAVADVRGGGTDAVEVGQVHGDDLAALHVPQGGSGDVGAAGGNEDPGPGGRQGPGACEAEPGVAPGHHGGHAREVVAGHDVLGGGGGGEGGVERLLFGVGHGSDATI